MRMKKVVRTKKSTRAKETVALHGIHGNDRRTDDFSGGDRHHGDGDAGSRRARKSQPTSNASVYIQPDKCGHDASPGTKKPASAKLPGAESAATSWCRRTRRTRSRPAVGNRCQSSLAKAGAGDDHGMPRAERRELPAEGRLAGADAPKSRSWKSGFLKKGSAPIEVVDAAHRLKLTDHVGQRVSVTGRLVDREMQVRSLQRVSASSARGDSIQIPAISLQLSAFRHSLLNGRSNRPS